MTDVTYTFRVDRGLKEAFVAMAEEQDLTAAQILRRMMRDAVEEHREAVAHEEWMRREIEAAMGEAGGSGGRHFPDEGIQDEWSAQRDAIRRHDDE